jgi:hypothetical protein
MSGVAGRKSHYGRVSNAPVLQNVQTEFAVGVHVGVEHFRQEFDGWGFVRVRLVKCENEFERPVLEGGLGCRTTMRSVEEWRGVGLPGPNITAFQSMMLSGHGAPEIPSGGSEDNRLKSRIRRRRQEVD